MLRINQLQRRETLLLEVQSRNKVGGIVDRRIGEDDPSMTAEERAIQRFAKERSRRKGASVFDLEGDELLTHGGRALDLAEEDYDAASLASESNADSDNERKRKRVDEEVDDALNGEEADQPDRKKSKAEVMEEVIKKSKLHKYERQKAKEDDDEIRRELDQDFSSIQGALGAFRQAIERGAKPATQVVTEIEEIEMHPDRAAMLNGSAAKQADVSYDEQLRKFARDQRAQPSDRTKTQEEKAQEEAELAKALEEKRMKRMMGEPLEDEDENDDDAPDLEGVDNLENTNGFDDDAAEFGLSDVRHTRPDGIDDEDDFLIEEGLIASDSETGISDEESLGDVSESEDELLAPNEDAEPVQSNGKSSSCPRTLEEAETLFRDMGGDQYHDTIRRIRLRHDASLDPENKNKLARFSQSLVEYLAVMPTQTPTPSSSTIDVVSRHIHSMARKSPEPVSQAFRAHLQKMHQSKSMTPGDLVILNAIGSIFPPSDHFHQIVTPALLLMARWLGMTTPKTPLDLKTGAYLCALCLEYQSLSKRYIPELVRFTTLALRSGHPKSLLQAHITNLTHMADLWSAKRAFIEIFLPAALSALQALKATKATHHLQVLLSHAQLSRRTLELHHHRPLAIKTFVPKFEESFDPRKHYDPDPDRAESARLRKEFKREKKGAMRELRKDASFLAREKLREKKEKDRAYEEKYRKIVAEIQGEEGREKNAYERVRRLRKGKR
jgi:nucleolar protein 14